MSGGEQNHVPVLVARVVVIQGNTLCTYRSRCNALVLAGAYECREAALISSC